MIVVGQPHGDARAVPVGQARAWPPGEPAGALPASSTGGRSSCGATGCRPRWWRWPPTWPRSSAAPSRCNLLFGLPAARRRADHRRRRLPAARPADAAGDRRFERVDHRAARRHPVGVPGRLVLRVAVDPAASRPPAWCRASTAPTASCWPPACSAPPSCRTRSTCTRRWRRAASRRRTIAAAAPGCCRASGSTSWPRMSLAGLVNVGDAARGRRAVRRVGAGRHGHPRRRARRLRHRARTVGARCCSRWRCWPPGLASASVGTYAGQVIMQGFLQPPDPAVRCAGALTLIPALVDPGAGRRADRGAGDLAGGALVRHPVRARPAAAADPPPRTSWASWSNAAPDDGGRRAGRRGDHRPERDAAGPARAVRGDRDAPQQVTRRAGAPFPPARRPWSTALPPSRRRCSDVEAAMSLEQDVAAARQALEAFEAACGPIQPALRGDRGRPAARERRRRPAARGPHPAVRRQAVRGTVRPFAGVLRRRRRRRLGRAGRTAPVTATAPRRTGAVTPGRGNGVPAPRRAAIAARTLRTDRWWLQPLLTVVVLVPFIIYSTFRAFQNAHYFAEPYISPFYSPCLTTSCEGDTFPELFTGPSLDLPGALHPGLPAGLPADLLLLPQGLLPVVLAVPAGLRGRRAAPRATPARRGLPLHRPEHPPVLLLRRRWSST